MYKKIIFKAKQFYYNDILKSHINDSKMTWIINELTGNKIKKNNQVKK